MSVYKAKLITNVRAREKRERDVSLCLYNKYAQCESLNLNNPNNQR